MQGLSGRQNTISTAAARLTSRLANVTPRNKILLGSALALALFLTVLATVNSEQRNDYLQPTSEFTTNASVNLDGLTELLPEVSQGQSNTETKVDVRASSNVNTNMSASPQVEVEVNGQEIPVPQTGEVSETVSTPEGDGSVHVNVQSSLSNTDDRDRTRIRIDSDSESEVRIRSSD